MRSRRDVVIGYAEFVAGCRVLGFGHLVKGEAPSIERMIRSQNVRVRKGGKELPFPPLPQMIAAKEADFTRAGVPEELEQRIRKWAPLKKEALANG